MQESTQHQADLIIYNAVVYTVDGAFSVKEALAVRNGRIAAVGSNEKIKQNYSASQIIDVEGRAVYPGFIDPHCHFYNYGLGLQQADLAGCDSFEEVLDRLKAFSKINQYEWIIGRGWDQNRWSEKTFPDKHMLDELFPDQAVLLTRIDGHAALANAAALKHAGIDDVKDVDGGVIEAKNGQLTGILIDNAIDLVSAKVPPPNKQQKIKALQDAQSDCFAVGLTTVDDAYLGKDMVDLIDIMQREAALKMRIYVMLVPGKEETAYYFKNGPYKTDRLNVRAFKFFSDGALGSRGAYMLQPYNDQAGQRGFMLHPESYFREMAERLFASDFQMNTHAIGDAANRVMLDIYGAVLKTKNDRRWRIEHAQIVHPDDFEKFGKYSIIPSVQATHATSDMYWLEDRVGRERMKGAYAYKTLLKQNGIIANGSDFPIEKINPLLGFYAAVARKDVSGFPEQGFQIENALTREEALKAMTCWSAYANFEENEKGSLEVGKFADIVILDEDIMQVEISKVPTVKVFATYVNGEMVYKQ